MVIAFRDHIVNHFTSLASLCLPFFTYIMSSILLVTLTISFLHITCIYKLQRNDIMYIHVGQQPNRSLPSKKASAMGSRKLVVYRRSTFPNRGPVLDRGQTFALFEFSNKIPRGLQPTSLIMSRNGASVCFSSSFTFSIRSVSI